MPLGRLAVAAGDAVQGRMLGAGGSVVDQKVHQLVDTDVPQS